MTSTVAVISVSLRTTVLSRNKAVATKYTQEGLEYFRAQRNLLGWETFFDILNGASASTYCLVDLPFGDSAGMAELPNRACLATEFVDEKQVYQRQAEVTTASDGETGTVHITVTTTWKEGGHELVSSASLELSDIYNASNFVLVFPSPVIPTPLPTPQPSPALYTLPAGAVIAMNGSSCPAGYSEFSAARGRSIIGTNPIAGGGISTRSLGQTGGAEIHTLTLAQLPAHTHAGRGPANSVTSGGIGWWNGGFSGGGVGMSTFYTGGNQPHTNMSPYYALLLCKKD